MTKLFSFSYFLSVFPKLISSIPNTILVVVVSLAAGLILGFAAATMKIYGNRFLSALASLYISFMRGVPLIALMLLVYFGFPQLMMLFGFPSGNWPKFPLIIAGFALNVSGYLAENMRSAYLSVEKGQSEAGLSIGFTSFQTFLYITFPQAFIVALPNLGNTIIMLIKDTALAFSLGIVDIMGKAVLINARNYGSRQMEIYIAVGLTYWALCFILEKIINFLEQKGRQFRERQGFSKEAAAK